MFRNLTTFAYKRTPKEAIGFYLAYLLIYLVIGALQGTITTVIAGSTDVGLITRVGTVISVLLSLILAVLILKSKHLLGNFL